jgi:NitT/TauT family transport system ATP-binding protein
MLELKNVCFSYGEQEILRDISLRLDCGERMAITGPSGCGKTTLLRIADSLLTASCGSVSNDFKRTAIMFQEPRLLPWLTAEENVSLVLNDADAHNSAIEWLTRFGLQDDLNKKPHELSGGMQQRVALARTMAYNGDLLLLDEPFKALDEETKNSAIRTLSEYTNAAIILITHDRSDADALGCKIAEFGALSVG